MPPPSLDPFYPKENGVANDEFSVRGVVSSNISADLCEIDRRTRNLEFNVPLGKGEVESSILSRSTSPICLTFCARRYTSVKTQFLRWIDLRQCG